MAGSPKEDIRFDHLAPEAVLGIGYFGTWEKKHNRAYQTLSSGAFHRSPQRLLGSHAGRSVDDLAGESSFKRSI
jgi:hypothetical protein